MKAKLIKFTILALTGFLCATNLFFLPSYTYAANDICSSNLPPEVKEANGCNHTGDKLPSLIQNIINVVVGISGLVATIFIIVGGVNYMTSYGDAGKIEKAKKTILYACIGLVVCVLAYAIVNWVIGAAQ